MEYAGRNRRYYRVTPAGWDRLSICKKEWECYAAKITEIFIRSGLGDTYQEDEKLDCVSEESEEGRADKDDEK